MILGRKTRNPETEREHSERLEQQARERVENASAEDKALDAAVRRSIEVHGP
jgi:hypothetical protein